MSAANLLSRRSAPAMLCLAALLAVGCAKRPTNLPAPVAPLPERGQIPVDRLEQAARAHGGSFRSTNTAPLRTASLPRGEAPPAPAGLLVVLGPVQAESVPPHVDPTSGDAGNAVRDVIREGIARGTSVALLEAPAEGHVEDAPRPDLARDGVRYVVKGSVRYPEEGEPVSVFLRAVDTTTGQVAAAASGRAPGPVAAAEQATARLVRNVTERARGGSGIGGSR